jgi:hypothetical protein
MSMQKHMTLVDAVQRNCHISDARHARDKTMCTYLLEMREFFRWERRIPSAVQTPGDELGDWMAQREALWDELGDAAFEPLPIAGGQVDPFDIDTVNRALLPEGLVYGAGVGRFHKPHFFLGTLLRMEQRDGLTIVVSEREYARDITAIPAAMQNGTIYLRQESLRRWLREKIELWGLKDTDGALKSAMECYGLRADREAGLDRMLARERETVVLHEIGEVAADRILGAAWKEMMVNLSSRREETFARAVRDNLADCLSTLPALLEQGAGCSLHFYFANLDGMRRALFPSLAQAYRHWREQGDLKRLRTAVAGGREHWGEVGVKLVNNFRAEFKQAGRASIVGTQSAMVNARITGNFDAMEKLETESVF